MRAVVSQEDLQQLRIAHRQIEQGQAGDALPTLVGLVSRSPESADANFVLGLALQRLGRLQEAEPAMRKAARLEPENFGILDGLADLLSAARRSEEAVAIYNQWLRKHPQMREAHINRALVAQTAGDGVAALRLVEESLERLPGDGRLLAIKGALLKKLGRLDEALEVLELAVAVEPTRALTHHNLAVVLNAVGEPLQACRHYERAAQLGLKSTDMAVNWATALLEAGELNAARNLLVRILEFQPSHDEAARALVRLRHEYDEAGDAFAHYAARVAASPDDKEGWRTWIEALASFRRFDELRSVAEQAIARHPDLPHATLGLAVAEAHAGNPRAGADRAERLHAQVPLQVGPTLIELSLMAGRADRAAQLGEQWISDRPFDQLVLAYLATAWRLLSDEREHWLCNYPELIKEVQVAPEGIAPHAYAERVSSTLERLHATRQAPGDQSLRSGTQSSGALFNRRDSAIREFGREVLRAASAAAAEFPVDANHPFLSRASKRLSFKGSWSVRLHPGGHHVAHIHSNGWMSSAYYARLPPDVEHADSQMGWIGFGAPPEYMKLNLPPRRLIKPAPGKMVLFPSYMWHGTIPFSSGERLTAAFDFTPE